MKQTGPISKIVYHKITSILLLFCLSTFIILSLWFYNKLDHSQKQRYLSYLAADELRQSSDDLTRMVRTYVMTKDPRYEKMYWDVLAIRNGDKARPTRYENIYWDFVAFTNEKPRPDGQKISLLEMMKDLEFTQEEFAKLAEAETYSNDLVKTEMIAMHAMKGNFLDAQGEFTHRGEPDYDYARAILYDESYHRDKVNIMTPIDEFFVMVNARTEAKVNRDMGYTYICVFLVYATIAFLLWLSRVQLNEFKIAQIQISKLAKFPSENPNPVLRITKDGEVLYSNQAGELLLSKWESGIGKTVPEKWRNLIAEAFASGKGTEEEEEVKDKIFSLTIAPVKEAGYANLYARDITDHKRAQDDLQKAYARLEEQSALLAQSAKTVAISTLVAGTAHELNNPLTAVLNFSAHCRKHTSKDDELYPVLENIEHEAKRCADIVRNLATFSDIGQDDDVYEKASLTKIIGRVFELLSWRIENEEISTTLDVAEDTPDIWMNATAVQQLILNLTNNALDALKDSDKKELNVDVSRQGEFVRMTFADTGCGIEDGSLKSIFDPFFTTKPVGQGVGLGLSACQGIIKAHGGQITCQSKLGAGMKFIILLPIERSKQNEQANTCN